MNKLCMFALAIILPATLQAQSAEVVSGDRKMVRISPASIAPVIDGRLDDEIWREIEPITDLHQTSPVDHAVPTQRSEIYITYDEDFFYVGARLYDDAPEDIVAREMIQGQPLFNDDNIHVILDTFDNLRTGFRFSTNPNGLRSDGVFEGPGSMNWDWSGIWQVRSQIDDEGWTAEMAIPFTTLNFNPNTEVWGFNVIRSISRNNEDIAWSSFNRNANPATSGAIYGIRDIRQGFGLDVVPSLTVAHDKDHIGNASDTRIDPSLDVFYKFTPNLTGALTINTDFSATEADDRQVNLTRFSVFFPEKRDFFLQDSEIFGFGSLGGSGGNNGIPFYSRRIGLNPGTGQPVDIDAGAKLAGRIGNTSVGTLLVQQGERPGLDEQRVFVGRVTQNVLNESRIGAIFTNGDPNSETDNSLAGVDFIYRNTRFSESHTLTGDFWYQQTDTEGVEGNEKAYSMDLGLSTQNTGLGGNLGYSYIGGEYNPALGFANRRGIEKIDSDITGRYYLSDHSLVRYLFFRLDASHTRSLDDSEMQSESLSFRPVSINSHQGDRFYAEVQREREGLNRDFEISQGVVIPAGKYAFASYTVGFEAASQRAFSPDFSYTAGDFYDGESREYSVGMDWQPSARFTTSFSYDITDVELPQGDFITRLISMDTTYALTAEWSWINLLQYDNLSDSFGLNSRVHWAPQAGEDLYLVINYNFDSTEGAFKGLNPTDSEIVLKYTRNLRF